VINQNIVDIEANGKIRKILRLLSLSRAKKKAIAENHQKEIIRRNAIAESEKIFFKISGTFVNITVMAVIDNAKTASIKNNSFFDFVDVLNINLWCV
jgi:hypothetical protein